MGVGSTRKSKKTRDYEKSGEVKIVVGVIRAVEVLLELDVCAVAQVCTVCSLHGIDDAC